MNASEVKWSDLTAREQQSLLDAGYRHDDGILRGNADLAEPAGWVPTNVQPGTTPLGVYPSPADLSQVGVL